MTSYQTNQEAIATEETTGINYVEIIENVIDTLEQDDSAMVNHTAEGGTLWKFKYGSVEVFVQIGGKTDEDSLTVWSVVLNLPAKDEPKLMRQLLEMNCSSTFEARFGIIENQVVVIAIRTLGELSPSEVSRIITVVASIADNNDDALQSEFGAA